MSIKTLDIEKLYSSDSNCYEQIVVIAKRARQIAAREKMELDDKLKTNLPSTKSRKIFLKNTRKSLMLPAALLKSGKKTKFTSAVPTKMMMKFSTALWYVAG